MLQYNIIRVFSKNVHIYLDTYLIILSCYCSPDALVGGVAVGVAVISSVVVIVVILLCLYRRKREYICVAIASPCIHLCHLFPNSLIRSDNSFTS